MMKHEPARSEKITFIASQLFTAASLVRAIYCRNIIMLLFAVGQSILIFAPFWLERWLRIHLPPVLKITLIVFTCMGFSGGNIFNLYYHIPWWDTMLHTFSGFLFCCVGYALPEVLDRHSRNELSPALRLAIAVCFSLAMAVLWELLEYGGYAVIHRDTEHDMLLDTIYTAYYTGQDTVAEAITGITEMRLIADGGEFIFPGYLDMGFMDTITDMLVHFIGVIVYCVLFFLPQKRWLGLWTPRLFPAEGEAQD